MMMMQYIAVMALHMGPISCQPSRGGRCHFFKKVFITNSLEKKQLNQCEGELKC